MQIKTNEISVYKDLTSQIPMNMSLYQQYQPVSGSGFKYVFLPSDPEVLVYQLKLNRLKKQEEMIISCLLN